MNPFRPKPDNSKQPGDHVAHQPDFPQSGSRQAGDHQGGQNRDGDNADRDSAPGDPSGRDPDATSDLIDSLQTELSIVKEQVGLLTTERDDLFKRYQAALAEMTNAARRARQSEEQAKDMGVRAVLLNILPVIDHFDFALNQDPVKVTASSVIAGVIMIKEELVKALATQGAVLVNPARNSEFDPMQQEAVMQQVADDVQPGHVVQTLRTGFVLAGRTVRPAQVILASRD